MRRAFTFFVTMGVWSTLSISAFAHGGLEANLKPHDARELLRSWEFDPMVVIGLVLSAMFYCIGVKKLRMAMKKSVGIRNWEIISFAAGWFVVFVALVSPLHPWGRVLFSAHMTQHEILMLVAAPLLVLGRPLLIFLKALPSPRARILAGFGNSAGWQKIWRVISNPFAAFMIHGVALWIWHIPSWFQATIESDLIHALQHMSFLFSALLFWWALMQGRQRASGYGLAVLYMFTTALHSGLLGALLTFTTKVWYPAYRNTSQPWGFTALEDQQLGGLIMWIPAGLIYIVAGLALFAGWIRESELRTRNVESSSHFSATPI
jgi:putative membrane protein